MKMSKKEKLQLIQDSALQGVAELHAKSLATSSKVGNWSKKTKEAILAAFIIGGLAVNSTIAFAAGGDCGGEAGTRLAEFIGKLASFLMLLGGALALLMFAVGALYIIAGSKQSNVSKGMGFIKNAAIGVGVLALGGLIKFLVTNLAEGGGGDKANLKCINDSDKGFK